MDRRCIHDGRRAVGGVRERRRDNHTNVYGHACCYYDADTGAAANTYAYPDASAHTNTHADASGPAASGACSCQSYGYGSGANTYAYPGANAHTTTAAAAADPIIQWFFGVESPVDIP